MKQHIVDGPGIVGASEMGVVMGLSPWQTPLELWRVKVGDAPRFEGNSQTIWGHEVEPAIRSWYVNQVGEPVYVPPRSLFHPEHAFLRASPDGLVLFDGDADPTAPANWARGFEAKKASGRVSHYWGEPGTDEVPLWYLIQCQQNMAVTGVECWDLAASIAGEPPAVYRIERDEDLVASIIDEGRRFVDLVRRREPPPIDGSSAWSDYLAERYPFTREDYRVADEEDEKNAATLRDIRASLRELEQREALTENLIKSSIGEHAGLQTSLGRLTWKPQRGRALVDWPAVATSLAQTFDAAEELERLVRANTTQAKGSRPLRVPRTWSPNSQEA